MIYIYKIKPKELYYDIIAWLSNDYVIKFISFYQFKLLR